MGPTHNVGTFLHLLKRFSEAQLLYPKISNDKVVGHLFSDSCKKQILWKYDFDLFEDEIYTMNKNRYIDFQTFAETINAFILHEEKKASKMDKSSETKK